MSMEDIEIVMPEGMLGPDEDYLLDSAIRAIAEKYAEEGEWANKYGVNYENDIFMMHRYCWCEQSNCPWCLGCECGDDVQRYFVDGKEVTRTKYQEAYEKHMGPAPSEQYFFNERNKESFKETSKERGEKLDQWYKMVKTELIPEKMCEYCRNQKDPAPNFHYKPLDLKVWWYKYIGRDMKSNKHLDHLQISEMLLNCLK
jgi:hypothetical protein